MSPNKTIYIISPMLLWQSQLDSEVFITESLSASGFIHACTKSQIDLVLNRYYSGVKDLLELSIDVDKVIPEIKYEEAPSGGLYPHIYGALNKNAITETKQIS